MFSNKSLLSIKFLPLLVFLLMSPFLLNAQEGFENENFIEKTDLENLSLEEVYEFYNIEKPKEIKSYEDYTYQELISEVYNSPMYKELMKLYGLDEESKTYFTLETFPNKNVAPKPYQNIKLAVKSSYFNSNTVYYTWTVDDEVIEEGYGLNILDITTKGVGESSVVSVNIKTDSGVEKNKSLTLTPATIDIFWQTNTYTPPVYKGKSLSSGSNKGKIDFIAIPNFTGTDKVENPDEYIYSWMLDGSNYKSGRGVNSISINLSDILSKSRVQISIKTLENEMIFKESLNFPNLGKPDIFVYATDSYGTDYSRALNYLKEYSLNQDLFTVKVEPMFFTNFKEDDLEINWFMNNNPISDFKDNRKAYFSVDRGFTGKSYVTVSVENRDNFREKIKSNVLFSVNNEKNLDI